MEFKIPNSLEEAILVHKSDPTPTRTTPIKREAVVIMQPAGLGDIIFSQGIAHHYLKAGMRVYWPVIEPYLHHLKRAYPNIEWLPENLYVSPRAHDDVDKIRNDLLHALFSPIRWSNTFQGVEYKDVMRAKYDMYKLDWRLWTESAMWVRDRFREDELMIANGVDNGEPYNLISENWGFAKGMNRVPVNINNGLKNVYIKQIDTYSLFDWAALIENAEQIHFVSSSNIYLLELLKTRASEIHIYQRLPDQPHHRNYDYILRAHEGKYRFH